MPDINWSTIIAAAIGAFSANFIGEWVKSFVRRSQSRETQRNDDLNEILKIINELGQLSEKYWPFSANELGQERHVLVSQIVSKQHYLSRLIADAYTAPLKYDCDVAVHDFMHVLTGDEFGEPDRTAQPERLTKILTNNLELAHTVRQTRRKLKRYFLA